MNLAEGHNLKDSFKIPRLITELSQDQKIISNICDALLLDLDTICDLARNKKVDCMKLSSPFTWHYYPKDHFDASIAGEYTGFGLGQNFLELGPFEEPVAEALLIRFEQMKKESRTSSNTVDTMFGPQGLHDVIFVTEKEVFELSHTYTWFVTKRVE